jgi:hypothetical protein
MATIWVNQTYFNKTSGIDTNVEFSKVTPVLNLVQRKYIKYKLGTDFYAVMEAAIVDYLDNATAIPADLKHLLDEFIMPAIVYYTLYEYTLPAKMRYTNKGIMVKRSENADPADDAGLELMMEVWKSNAELHIHEMEQYISVNQTLYPAYFTNNSSLIIPDQTSYDVDVYLG